MTSLILLTIFMTTLAITNAQTDVTWAKRVEAGAGKEVVTTMEFYFHDILSGKNPSAVRIAQSATSNSSQTLFGVMFMVDDALTIGPDPSSKLIGRARGTYGSAGQTDLGLMMALSFGFLDGVYNGSSFSVLSINTAMYPVREMAIVGGTGMFRMCRGYAIAQTYSFDVATGDAVVGYNVTLLTYV